MGYEFFELPVFYEADIIPVKCRKPRQLSCVDMHTFHIKKTDTIELVGIKVGYNNCIEEFYKNEDSFYTPLGLASDASDEDIKQYVDLIPHYNDDQTARYIQKQMGDDYISGITNCFRNIHDPENLRHNIQEYAYTGFPYKIENFHNPLIDHQDIKTLLVDNKETYIKNIQNKLDTYIIHNGIIYKKTKEPKILLNHSGGEFSRLNSDRRIVQCASRNFAKNSDDYKRQYFSFSLNQIDMAYNMAQEMSNKDIHHTSPCVSSENNFLIINPDAFSNNPYQTVMENIINIPGYDFFNIIKMAYGEEKRTAFIDMVYNIFQNGCTKEDVNFFIESLIPLTKLSSMKDFCVNNARMMMDSIVDEPKSNLLFSKQDDKFNLKPGVIDIPDFKLNNSSFILK